MSSAKKCDRCGKFFEEGNTHCTYFEITTCDNANRNFKFDCGLNDDLDLCPDCVESFKHWWANENKEK